MMQKKLLVSLLMLVLLSTLVAGCTTTTSPVPTVEVGFTIMDTDLSVMWSGNVTWTDNIPEGGPTVMDALENASMMGNFDYDVTSFEFGNYVSGIMDKTETAESGWMFYVNESMSLEAADKTHVSTGSTILWFFGGWGDSPFPE